eukprot:1864382-Amphidinium_carterae.2
MGIARLFIVVFATQSTSSLVCTSSNAGLLGAPKTGQSGRVAHSTTHAAIARVGPFSAWRQGWAYL